MLGFIAILHFLGVRQVNAIENLVNKMVVM